MRDEAALAGGAGQFQLVHWAAVRAANHALEGNGGRCVTHARLAIGVIAAGVLAGNLLAADPRPARAAPTPLPARTTGRGVRLTSATAKTNCPRRGARIGRPQRAASRHDECRGAVAQRPLADGHHGGAANRTSANIPHRFAHRLAFGRRRATCRWPLPASRSTWPWRRSMPPRRSGCRRFEAAPATTATKARFNASKVRRSSHRRGGSTPAWAPAVYGTTQPAVQGLYANFDLADAFFEPLAARRFAGSRRSGRRGSDQRHAAASHAGLFRIAALGRGPGHFAGHARRRASTGRPHRGLCRDRRRAARRRQPGRGRIGGSRRTTCARPARPSAWPRRGWRNCCGLDPTVVLRPADRVRSVPMEIVPGDVPVKELVIAGLSPRPELAENRELVAEAVRPNAARADGGADAQHHHGWQLSGHGLGHQRAIWRRFTTASTSTRSPIGRCATSALARRPRGVRRNRTCAPRNSGNWPMMDQVAREVVEAHCQVQARQDQMATARLGVEAALASQRQNLDRIEQAKGLPIEVLQSIQALAQARREYLRTVDRIQRRAVHALSRDGLAGQGAGRRHCKPPRHCRGDRGQARPFAAVTGSRTTAAGRRSRRPRVEAFLQGVDEVEVRFDHRALRLQHSQEIELLGSR